MQRFTRPLFGQVLIALAVGIALGIWAPEFAQKLQPLGDGFLKLIKMLIAPIVFSVVVVGICGAGELKKVGRVGGKAVIYFEIVTTIAPRSWDRRGAEAEVVGSGGNRGVRLDADP